MDENISIWKLGLTVMSVRDTDDRNRTCERFGWDDLMPGVELPREEDARLRQEWLPNSGPRSIKEFDQAGARPAEHGHD